MIFVINTILAIAILLELDLNLTIKGKKITIHILPVIVMILFNLLVLR